MEMLRQIKEVQETFQTESVNYTLKKVLAFQEKDISNFQNLAIILIKKKKSKESKIKILKVSVYWF